jgi:hypothetical protein
VFIKLLIPYIWICSSTSGSGPQLPDQTPLRPDQSSHTPIRPSYVWIWPPDVRIRQPYVLIWSSTFRSYPLRTDLIPDVCILSLTSGCYPQSPYLFPNVWIWFLTFGSRSYKKTPDLVLIRIQNTHKIADS